MQMNNIIENPLINHWRQIDSIGAALEHMTAYSADEICAFLQSATPDAHNVLLLSGGGDYLDRAGEHGLMQITKDLLGIHKGFHPLHCPLCAV